MLRPASNIGIRTKEWISPFVQAKNPIDHAKTMQQFLKSIPASNQKRPVTTMQPQHSNKPGVFVPIEDAAQYLEAIHQQVTE
jgi:hypothetical protein